MPVMGVPEQIEDEEHEQRLERVAAIDVAKASGKVCTRVPHESKAGKRVTLVWDVAATTNAICELAAHLVEQDPGQVCVVVVEAAVQGLHQRGVFDPHPAAGQLGQLLRVTLAGDQRFDHVPAGLAEDVGGHRGQFDQSVLEEFLHALLVPGPFAGQIQP